MAEALTDLDNLLLERWHDAVGIRDALKELEGRLESRLELAAERLRPWLEERGYQLLDLGSRYAELRIVKHGWMKNKKDALIWVSVLGLFPYGYRRVAENHPWVWICAHGLPKNELETFGMALTEKLKNSPEAWINEECDSYYPAGHYITSHGDRERIELARSEDGLEQFVKTYAAPMLALGAEIDAALELAHGPLKTKRA